MSPVRQDRHTEAGDTRSAVAQPSPVRSGDLDSLNGLILRRVQATVTTSQPPVRMSSAAAADWCGIAGTDPHGNGDVQLRDLDRGPFRCSRWPDLAAETATRGSAT
ncbi:hypothetical protein GCM10022214_02830 [Actinomadura miaoliensis]|uniref:Transposase n=1 Tax=Actinomadura miaoliensis TaxID=430685 RepID=A0ABP7UXW5_9ACTN